MSDGAPATTIGGKAIAYAGGTLHIGETVVTMPSVSGHFLPTTMVADGLTFSIGPSPGQSNDLPVLVIGYTQLTANEASQFVYGGQTLAGDKPVVTVSGTRISLDTSRTKAIIGTSSEPLHIRSLIINGFGAPSLTPLVTINGIVISEDATKAVISGTTYSLGHDVSPSSFTVGSQILVLGPSGVQALSTLSIITSNGITFSMDASQAIISSTIYSLGHDVFPTSVTVGSQTLLIGPSGVQIGSVSSIVTYIGLVFSMHASQAIISGTTYSLGDPAPSSALIIGGQTFVLGPSGISAEATLSPLTAGGLTFSMDATEALISGTTNNIGTSANPTTVVLGNQTVSIGPSGVGLASTSVVLPNATGTSFQYFTGKAPDSSVPSSSLLGVSLLCLLVAIAIMWDSAGPDRTLMPVQIEDLRVSGNPSSLMT